MKTKYKILITLGLILIIAFCAVFFFNYENENNEPETTFSDINTPEDAQSFKAIVLEVLKNSVLVEPVAGSDILHSADKIVVSIDNASLFNEDDLVQIVYDGTVQESYPAQIPKSSVYSVSLCGGSDDPSFVYESACGYSGHINDSSIYLTALNSDKMSISSVLHLPIFKFNSKNELDLFTSKYFEHTKGSYSYDEMPYFEKIVAHCDEEFFKENILFAVYVEAPSGSFRYGVKEIYNDSENFSVHIEKTNDPETYTTDVVSWIITVTAKKEAVQNCTVFDATLDN